MSKIKRNRQQSQEIERVLKAIDDGLKEYQILWADFSKNQTSKMEQQVRQSLQKLQKMRAQIRQWQEDPTLKEHHVKLTNYRQLIEAEMSRFKVSEKTLRNKDDSDADQDEAIAWINRCITNLKVEIAELEHTESNKKQKKVKEQQATVYKNHLEKFEMIKHAIQENFVNNDDIDAIRQQIDEFIEQIKLSYSELDFDIYQNIEQIVENEGHIEEQFEQDNIELKKVQQDIYIKTNQILEQEQKQKEEKEKQMKERKEKERLDELKKIEETKKQQEEETKKRIEEEIQKKIADEQKIAEQKRLEEQKQQELSQSQLSQSQSSFHSVVPKSEFIISQQNSTRQTTELKIDSQPRSNTFIVKTPLKLQSAPAKQWSLSSTGPNTESVKINGFSTLSIQKCQKEYEPKLIENNFFNNLQEQNITFQSQISEQLTEQQIKQQLEFSFTKCFKQSQQFGKQLFQFNQVQMQGPTIQLSDQSLNKRLQKIQQQIPQQQRIQIKNGQKCSSYQSIKREFVLQFQQLPADTLLYVFHHFPGTIEQELAGEALKKLQWNYNKIKNIWCQKRNGIVVWYNGQNGQIYEGEIQGGLFEWI